MTEVDTEKDAAPTRRDWIDLAVLSVGLGAIVFDGTNVGVALPAIILTPVPARYTLTSISGYSSLKAALISSTFSSGSEV